MTVTRVAVVQFAPELEPTANAQRMRSFAAQAAANGASLVVFPEYSSSFNQQLDSEVLQRAQIVKGEFVSEMQAMARELHVSLVFGFVEQTSDEAKFANTVLAIGADGTLLAKYQKAHLYDAFGQKESDKVIAGKLSVPPTFQHGGLTVGLQTCYDLRFPEQTRWLVEAGAQLVLVPAEWVPGKNKVHHWKTLLAARAIENTIYIAAADHPEPAGVGHSVIFDPLGNQLAEIVDGEGVTYSDIDSAFVERVREVNPSIFLRRFKVQPK